MANSQSHVYLCILCLCFIFHVFVTVCSEDKVNEKTEDEEKWKKKHITDYNDADLERLLEQWDVSLGQSVLDTPVVTRVVLIVVKVLI